MKNEFQGNFYLCNELNLFDFFIIKAGRAAQANKNQSNETVQANRISGMSLEEAKQILNIKDLDENILKERYEHLFNANNKSKGGSFYIQSKVKDYCF